MYKWKYEEYDQWSRTIAANYTKKEIEDKLYHSDSARTRLVNAHRRAIEKTHSMTSNAQRRAQTRNSMIGNYAEYCALGSALEIYRYYPEKTKEGAKELVNSLLQHLNKRQMKKKSCSGCKHNVKGLERWCYEECGPKYSKYTHKTTTKGKKLEQAFYPYI